MFLFGDQIIGRRKYENLFGKSRPQMTLQYISAHLLSEKSKSLREVMLKLSVDLHLDLSI